MMSELVHPRARRRPEPSVPESVPPLPSDVFEIIVNALADALVLDYQQETDAVVESRKNRVMTLGSAARRLKMACLHSTWIPQ